MRVRLAVTSLMCLLAVGCAASGGGGRGAGSGRTAIPTGSDPGSGSASAGVGMPDAGSAGGDAGGASGSSPGSSGSRADGSADPGMPPKTAAERRADLDGKLDASLDSFDEKLRSEQQRTASERDSGASARADGAVVDSTSSGERERDDIRRDRSGDLQSAGLQEDADAASDQKGTGNGVAAKPIPSGVDDDIIARRLRRAAENETDPELREKLWDEYRDYKENTKGSK